MQLDPLVAGGARYDVKCETFLSRLCHYDIYVCVIVVADEFLLVYPATFHPSRTSEQTQTHAAKMMGITTLKH